MVPVSLRLKNFMSYGTEVPQLDFELFHTACLSGDNGQGKSALLDAITWALWGKARKAAGRLSPSQDLLRIGHDEMQVELVFDLDHARYRVIRTYLGSRGRSFLELHACSPEDQQYKSLSGTGISQTQKVITDVIGLDYDTFINSALLLQGRSDEFANRSPGNRKEILARILNLGRYEELRRMASDKAKEANQAAGQADADVERISRSLESEPKWVAEQKSLRRTIQEKEESIASVRSRETELIGRLAQLEGLRDQVDRLQTELSVADERLQEYAGDAAAIKASIEEAEALVRRADAIKRNHLHMLSLQKERQQLDELGQIHLGIEREREQKLRQLTERRHKAEIQLKGLSSQLSVSRRDLQEVNHAEEELPRIRRRLEAVTAAARRESVMRKEKARVEQLKEKARKASNSIENQRSVLLSRMSAVKMRREQLAGFIGSAEMLATRQRTLQRKAARYQECTETREATREEGITVAGELSSAQGRRQGREEQRDKARQQLDYLSMESDGKCPTCGTQLTPGHRAQVHAELHAEISSQSELLEQERRLEVQLIKRRTRLVERWKVQNSEVMAIEEAQVELAGVVERLAQQEQYKQALAEEDAKLKSFRQQLKEEDFAQEARTTLTVLAQVLKKADFDEREFEGVRHEAAQSQRYTELMAKTRLQIARKAPLVRDIKRLEEEELELRKRLDDGMLFGKLLATIRHLEAQLKTVGYDPARLYAAKQELESLKDAGEEMTRLATALGDREKLKNRLDATRTRVHKATLEREAKANQVHQISARMEGMQESETQLRQCQKERDRLEGELNALRVQYGEVSEKLATAALQRKQLKKLRKEHRNFKTDAQHYSYLMQAFGKHGIPSMIIEETLPDIEQRAGSLLERLTDGKMSIRIDTLRSKKKGGTIETLDIKVNDELGEYRAYETFSGGEAYRVNFALRIALSQLLAARNGVRMRLLVVDEGFGTQDQSGVRNLLQAIAEVRSEFDKILVITHIPEVKEVFPVRIEVKKDPVAGSRFEMIGV